MMVTPEKIKHAETSDEMQAEIFRQRNWSPLVRQVMDMADYQGMSAEDRYAVLAYHALRERERLAEVLLNDVATRSPVYVMPDVAGN